MATVAELQARLAALEALPAGVRQMQYQGEMISYNGPLEIAAEKRRLRAEIDALENRRRGHVIGTRGGYY